LFQSHGQRRGHVVFVHTELSPLYEPFSLVQFACVVMMQRTPCAFVCTQHAPRAGGGGQVKPVAVHAVFALNVPPIWAHTPAVVSMHASGEAVIDGLQHAPRGAQMSLLQTVLLPR
jgi:hypothetical protein